MTTKNISTTSGIRGLPSDLTVMLGERGLLNLVLDAVQKVDPACFESEMQSRPGYRPQMLLTLLTYCYTARIYGSRDIEWAARYDRTVRYICAHNFPDWQMLRRFRRQHRQLLEQTLSGVFRQAWSIQFGHTDAGMIGYDWSESDLNRELAGTVAQRLDVAALMDGVESD